MTTTRCGQILWPHLFPLFSNLCGHQMIPKFILPDRPKQPRAYALGLRLLQIPYPQLTWICPGFQELENATAHFGDNCSVKQLQTFAWIHLSTGTLKIDSHFCILKGEGGDHIWQWFVPCLLVPLDVVNNLFLIKKNGVILNEFKTVYFLGVNCGYVVFLLLNNLSVLAYCPLLVVLMCLSSPLHLWTSGWSLNNERSEACGGNTTTAFSFEFDGNRA